MGNSENIKKIVKEKYSSIATTNSSCCEGNSSPCCDSSKIEVNMIGESYKNVEGHFEEADLNLGCGVPTEYAGLKPGQIVVDLGCGAGNDVFIARKIIAEEGKVIGIDFTEEMIEKANLNKEKLGYQNVEFILGEIENIPLPDNFADVVISNCVLNLVPDKRKAYSEIFRILKSGAHFCISDVVTKGDLPELLKKDAELYAGCVAGALELDKYLEVINDTGFKNIEVKKLRKIDLPDEIILKYYSTMDRFEEFRKSFKGIYSATIVGYKI